MLGVCQGVPDLPIRDNALLVYKQELGCDFKQKRRMYTAWKSPIEGTWVPSVHANCNHNEVVALLKRSLAPTPTADVSSRAPCLRWFRRLAGVAKRYSGSRWSFLETAQSYSGTLRARYLEAERSLREEGPVTVRDTLLGAFLKAEKFGTGKYGKPRMIFPRSPRYNLHLASYLKPFEHWLWGYLTSRRLFGGSNTRVVAKGLNMRQRAALIRKKFLNFADCVVFEVDGSAFEAHVDVWQLQQEHAVYAGAYGGDPELARLLVRQLVNEGTTPGGVRFSRSGGRASGDFNTGMGNSIIMTVVVTAVLKHLGVSFDILVDGDNALVFLPRAVSERVVSCFAPLALSFSGHEMVLEHPVHRLEEVRFGQCAPVELSPGNWTMVRDWVKVVSQMTSSHVHLQHVQFAPRFLRGVGQCELALNSGVPVAQALARSLVRATEGVKAVDDSLYRDYAQLGVDVAARVSARYREPSQLARESFARAFGVTPDEQVSIERALTFQTLSLSGWRPEESQWTTGHFSARPGLVDAYKDKHL